MHITSTIKCGCDDLASQTGYTGLPYLLNMLMEYNTIAPHQNVASALEVLSIALLQMTSLVEMFSSTRQGHPMGQVLQVLFGLFAQRVVTTLVVQDSAGF